MQPDLVFLDFDKTLADIQDAGMAAWKSGKSQWLLEEYNIASTLTPLFPELEKIRNINDSIAEEILHGLDLYELTCNVEPLPYARQIFNTYSAQSKVLITSNGRPIIEGSLTKFGWLNKFDCIITRNDTQKQKPYHEPFLEALKKMNLKLEDLHYFIMVGDSWKDLRAAASLAEKTAGSFSFYKPEHLIKISF